jgi:hypothetical protein
MQRGWLAERRRVQGGRAQGWGGEWALLLAGGGGLGLWRGGRGGQERRGLP